MPRASLGERAAVTSRGYVIAYRQTSCLCRLGIYLCEFSLEQVSLFLAVEGDLKPNPAIGVGNRLKRNRLDVSVVQPCADRVHTTKGGSSAMTRSFLWL